MKVGVLTWKLHNYGTALQAYALVSYIDKINRGKGECKLLNYSLPSTEKLIRVNGLSFESLCDKVKNRIKISIYNRKNKKYLERFSDDLKRRNEKFRQFYNQIPHDDHEVGVLESKYFNEEYDNVIVGSDQVWNPKYLCNTYFLDFIDDSKKNSYAASLGVSSLTKNEQLYFRDRLEGHFKNISVREETGCQLLNSCLKSRKVVNVLDPTLLFSEEEWIKAFKLSRDKKEEYILVYALSCNAWYIDAIKSISEQLGIRKILYITNPDNLFFYADRGKIIVDAGPYEFLNLFLNAEFIITDSFHGVCFSVNFHKKFICMERFKDNDRTNENSRAKDLMKLLNCENLFINNKEKYKYIKYDFHSLINSHLSSLRNKSIVYLNQLIK